MVRVDISPHAAPGRVGRFAQLVASKTGPAEKGEENEKMSENLGPGMWVGYG